MQVSLRIGEIDGVRTAAFVGFEFGTVKDPHELLQDETRIRLVPTHLWAPTELDDLVAAMLDPHRGLLGRRGNLWIDPPTRAMLAHKFADWKGERAWFDQILDPASMLWVARRIPDHHFRVPALVGLTDGHPLHDAVQQSVLLQAAGRALKLHRDFNTRRSPTKVRPESA